MSHMGNDGKPLGEQLKKVVDDLDLEGKLQAAAAAAEETVQRGLAAAGQYVHEHREAIDGAIASATSQLDGQTGGRFSGQLGRLQESLSAGVASLAERRQESPEAPSIEPGEIASGEGESPGSP